MKKLDLNESFISRIWETPSYYEQTLLTTDNKELEILDYGVKNLDAGPDFKEARIRLNGILYSGDIEIHRNFHGWKQHNHKGDNKYNKVILQVVFWEEEDENKINIPKVKKAREIPTVILSKFLKQSIHFIWKEIINNPSPAFKLPCYPKNLIVNSLIKSEIITELSYKRLKYKAKRIKNRLEDFEENKNKKSTWDKILFEFICEALGYSKNKEPFLKLSRNIEFSELENNKFFLDAVLFGSAGFLFDLRFKDDYILSLKSIWEGLKNKKFAEVLDKSEWNFFRLRPSNFPTVRISYASGLLYSVLYENFLKEVVTIFNESNEIYKELFSLFQNIEVSAYWENHYNFGKETKSKTKSIGKERINDIITNVIIPFIFLYSTGFEIKQTEEKVLHFYNTLRYTGSNEITRIMEKQLKVKARTVAQEQGLVHLHNFLCIKGKCFECGINEKIFADDNVREPLKIIMY